MPDQKNKLVKVQDLGVVAFPETMPDEQVASVIKEFRSKPTKDQLAHTHQTSPHFDAPKLEKSAPTSLQKQLEEARKQNPNLTGWANTGYMMFGGDANNPKPKVFQFEQVPQAIQQGYIWFDPDQTSRYVSDFRASKPSALKKAANYVDESLTPKPGGDPTQNLLKAIDRAVYIGVPAFVTGIAKAAYSDATNQTQGALIEALDPSQIPKGLYDQYQADKKVDPRMANSNLVGSLIGMYASGKIGEESPLKVTSSVIPDDSLPSRINARSIHANPAGEVRMGADNIPTVWLRPQAWQEYLRVAHPEEKNPQFIAGENVATDQNFRNVAGRSGLSDHPTWEHTQELLRKAHGSSPRGTAVLAPKAGSLSNAVRVIREEKIHAWQRSLAQNKDINSSLKPETFNQLAAAMPKAMRDYLGKDYGDASNPMFVSEAAARFIANDLHGATPAEATQFLSKYFDAIVQQHGPNALATLEHTRGVAKQLQEIIDEEHRSADSGATPGGVRDVQAERPAGASPIVSPTPTIQPAYRASSIEELKAQAARLDPTNWIRTGAQTFAQGLGRDINTTRYLTPDFRATEIADAFQAMKHNPSDPAVAATYDSLKRDIQQQWDYATQKMGVTFEPWNKEGQPYQNSAEMVNDVKANKHLYFFQGGDMTADHPLAEKEGDLTYNDKLRAVHDLFGHAMEGFQFGPRGEENAWNAHAQMFSPESLPALTSETKGQNSWVNFGPHMRDAQGNLVQQGQPGWLSPAQRPFAEQKAGLLPDRFQYRVDTPVSFVSPSRFDLTLPQAGVRLGSKTHQEFQSLSGDLARQVSNNVLVDSAIGSWQGGAENSVLHQFPAGADPDAVIYHGAIMAKLGNQNSFGAFFPDPKGNDALYAFWVDGKKAGTQEIASVLTKNGITGSTIEPSEGGYTVFVTSDGGKLRPNIGDVKKALGVNNVEEYSGRAEYIGDANDRDAAERNYTSAIEEIESRHPDWRRVREGFESRPDYGTLHSTIRSTERPFVEVTHGSTKPGLEEISPEKYGTGPQRGGELKRMNAWPQYWEPRSYFQVKGTRGEKLYQNLPHQYQALLNSENIYDVARDPEDLASLIPPELTDPAGRFTALEQIVKETGYDGIATPDGVIEVFKGTPAESAIKREGLFSRKPRTWEDVLPMVSEDEKARNDTPEKQAKFMETINNSVVDPDEWDAAVKAGATGRLWYERSSRAFDALVKSQPDIFQPKDKNKFLNFIAALSPVQTVRLNLLMAINLWDKWNKAGRPMDVEWNDPVNFKDVKDKNSSLYRIMKGGKKSFGVALPARLQNAIRALQDQKLSGPKVQAFGPNLGSDADRSTNDTWMAVFAGIDPGAINRPHVYDAVSVMAREAGVKNGIPTRQAQAAVWSFIKSLAEVAGWGNDRWRPPEEVIKQGLLTPDLINEHVADFADMLAHDGEIRARISDIGGDLNALDQKLGRYVPERPAPEPASAILTRLLGAARRLEAARADSKIQSHLAAKSDEPSLFATEFSPEKMEGAFNRSSEPELDREKEKRSNPKLDTFMDDLWKNTTGNPFDPRERIVGDKAGIEAWPWYGRIHLSFIRSFEQGKGHGSEALSHLTDLADKHGVPIELSVKRVGKNGLSNANLRKWYGRYGFKKEIGDHMVREPLQREGVPMFHREKSLSTPERQELATLEDKRWKKTITVDEQKRYYELSDRDTASKHGLVIPAEDKKQLDEFRSTFELIQNLKAEAEKINPDSYQP